MYERKSLYIGGRWVAPAQGGVLDVISPSTEQVIGHAPLASVADIDGAVAAAREAFDSGPWPRTSPEARAEWDRGWAEIDRAWKALDKPVIAAINGPAVGIGATMLLPMDIRLASSEARIGFVFSRRGITPEINAVSTIIFVFSLVTIVFWYRLRVRSEGGADTGAEVIEAIEGNAL